MLPNKFYGVLPGVPREVCTFRSLIANPTNNPGLQCLKTSPSALTYTEPFPPFVSLPHDFSVQQSLQLSPFDIQAFTICLAFETEDEKHDPDIITTLLDFTFSGRHLTKRFTYNCDTYLKEQCQVLEVHISGDLVLGNQTRTSVYTHTGAGQGWGERL